MVSIGEEHGRRLRWIGGRELSGGGKEKLKNLSWGKVIFWYNSVRISKLKGDADLAQGICIIWSMSSGVMRNRVSPDEDMTALCSGM